LRLVEALVGYTAYLRDEPVTVFDHVSRQEHPASLVRLPDRPRPIGIARTTVAKASTTKKARRVTVGPAQFPSRKSCRHRPLVTLGDEP
jgi:hypothetical protein